MISDVVRKKMIDEIYAELPAIDCKQQCAESCGPIDMSRIEWERIGKKLKGYPMATSLTCPMLKQGLCSVYAIRPMICRLWAVVETMRCPWGCVPERFLSHEEGLIFLARISEIGTPEEAERWRATRVALEQGTAAAKVIVGATERPLTTWSPE